jgi:hypothetical protein
MFTANAGGNRIHIADETLASSGSSSGVKNISARRAQLRQAEGGDLVVIEGRFAAAACKARRGKAVMALPFHSRTKGFSTLL